MTTVTRITLSRAHTSAKAADDAKLLLLNKQQIIYPPIKFEQFLPGTHATIPTNFVKPTKGFYIIIILLTIKQTNKWQW